MRNIKITALGVVLLMTSLSLIDVALATVSQKKAPHLSNHVVFLKLFHEYPKNTVFRYAPRAKPKEDLNFFNRALIQRDTLPIELPEIEIMPLQEGHCSGTMIHPKFILTAAHCVAPYTAGYFGETLRTPLRSVSIHLFEKAFNRDGIKLDSAFNADAQVRFHSSYSPNLSLVDYINYDIALIYYKKGLTHSKFKPVKLYGGTLKKLIPIHQTFEVAGFGVAPAFLQKVEEGLTSKAQFVSQKEKEELTFPPLELTYDFVEAALTHTYKRTIFAELVFAQTLENGITPGDSGGPTFITLGNDLIQVGINSYMDLTSRSLSSATFVGTYRPWIDQVILNYGENPKEVKWVQ